MRKIVIASGIAALVVAAPFVANAVVMPAAMLAQGPSDAAPAPIKVRKHTNFLPIALGAALIGGGVAAAASGGSGNSPS